MTFVAALFSASVRFRFGKKTCSLFGTCLFFAAVWKFFFAFFAEISIFLMNYITGFQKNGKTGCYFMGLHFLLISSHFTSFSAAFESFSS